MEWTARQVVRLRPRWLGDSIRAVKAGIVTAAPQGDNDINASLPEIAVEANEVLAASVSSRLKTWVAEAVRLQKMRNSHEFGYPKI